ncbi:MAG: 2-C-methyl-D-erythritol 2,4-cyclodiphosphate synthase, partial [Erysipelotrichaceae bacterium]|nr:2-C-methyl-D-erythritol 2,4-cyclodiphosphate synthase [Erysipelotrichaceae bacterium]
MIRIGQSKDIHRLVEGRKLILGGVEIPHYKGLLGHRDADCLTHAVIESIIGALGLKDIGTHFPDTDPRYEGVSSLILLEHTYQMMEERG